MCVSFPRAIWDEARKKFPVGARYTDVYREAQKLTLAQREKAQVPEPVFVPAEWLAPERELVPA